MDLKSLISKYSKPGPRYTSYPTAPQWKEDIGLKDYKKELSASDPDQPFALYVHIPFCESLCYYCGCNIKITKDPSVGHPYVEALCREIQSVTSQLGTKRKLAQVSLGGGTPTYLSVDQLKELVDCIKGTFEIQPNAEMSIEVDPRVTTQAHLESLRNWGFNRISFGVQDFNEVVQKAVNRMQSAELTESSLTYCRKLGYTGINFDLLYGLPHQTLRSFEKTIDDVIRMRPDRIALYNYARLPQMIKHQTVLEKYPMPEADERVEIFSLAFDKLTKAGYGAIGMDHFALKTDELYQAIEDGRLYRNFMGYTVSRARNLLGIGASAIGELENAYFQNHRDVRTYQNLVNEQGFSTFRGFKLSPEDKRRKWIIQNIMCRFELMEDRFQQNFGEKFSAAYSSELKHLEAFYDEGILEENSLGLKVTELGRLFVRNAAMAFDAYLKPNSEQRFSKTV